ncbi:MAG: YabP/YqfC family sporulation protein [Lachnospiraceae bacterium]|nr:YabP/YqfC family sporulation protein [Ruminococcus sp.]MCM1276549.1 YabP/YqfC family sporulation protein [Lachnospiraceae bacterium]
MGIRERLIEYEETAGKRFSVTVSAESGRDAELLVENCRCVKSCDDNFIVLAVCGMDIRVSGMPLVIENFGVGSLRITGKIHSLTFEEN